MCHKLVRNFAGGSLPCTQQPASCPYPEANQSNTLSPTLFFKTIYVRFFQAVSLRHVSPPKSCSEFLFSAILLLPLSLSLTWMKFREERRSQSLSLCICLRPYVLVWFYKNLNGTPSFWYIRCVLRVPDRHSPSFLFFLYSISAHLRAMAFPLSDVSKQPSF